MKLVGLRTWGDQQRPISEHIIPSLCTPYNAIQSVRTDCDHISHSSLFKIFGHAELGSGGLQKLSSPSQKGWYWAKTACKVRFQVAEVNRKDRYFSKSYRLPRPSFLDTRLYSMDLYTQPLQKYVHDLYNRSTLQDLWSWARAAWVWCISQRTPACWVGNYMGGVRKSGNAVMGLNHFNRESVASPMDSEIEILLGLPP